MLGDRRTRRWTLVVAALVGSDILLALMVWQAAFVVQTAFGRFPLSEIPVASIVSNIVAW